MASSRNNVAAIGVDERTARERNHNGYPVVRHGYGYGIASVYRRPDLVGWW